MAPEPQELSVIINRKSLLQASPIKNMADSKLTAHGTSYGLSEAGYDIRIKQDIRLVPKSNGTCLISVLEPDKSKPFLKEGRFTLASAMEEFDVPLFMVGVVHDKSTWARKGLSVFNTVIEPGWKGFLTLELVYHGHEDLHIPAGSGIAQILFHSLSENGRYEGKYQNQEDRPVDSKFVDGPVKIIDSTGVFPSNLDVAVQQQCYHSWEYRYDQSTHVCKKCGYAQP